MGVSVRVFPEALTKWGKTCPSVGGTIMGLGSRME